MWENKPNSNTNYMFTAFSFQVSYLFTKKYVDSAKGEVIRSMQEERSTQEERGGFKGVLRTCNYLAVWQTSLHLGFIKFQIQASVRFIKFQWIKYSCVHTDCICKRTYCYQQRSQFNAKPRQATWVQNKQLVLIKWLWN